MDTLSNHIYNAIVGVEGKLDTVLKNYTSNCQRFLVSDTKVTCVRHLANSVASWLWHWDHYNPEQKVDAVSKIRDERQRLKEIHVCSMLHLVYHQLFKSNVETRAFGNNIQIIPAQKVMQTWKKKKMKENKYERIFLKEQYGLDCLMGYSDGSVAEKEIKIVQAFLNEKGIELNGPESYDSLDYFLSSWHIHHIDPTLKNLVWNRLHPLETQKQLKYNGELICACCHGFVSFVFNHFGESYELEGEDIEV